MKKIKFYKFTGAGNDFVMIDNRKKTVIGSLPVLARKMCDRKFGVGADGFILLEKSRKAAFRMKYLNSDGSHAAMCGNGARCIARFANMLGVTGRRTTFETDAGPVDAEIYNKSVKIKLSDPVKARLDMTVPVKGRNIKVSFIDTGVPHAVIFTDAIEKYNVCETGRIIRHHGKFAPAGTNVDFVKIKNADAIIVRTYERGVEGETLACGTGATASAIISVLKGLVRPPVSVFTRSKIVFRVSCRIEDPGKIKDVYLDGPADFVFTGEYRLSS